MQKKLKAPITKRGRKPRRLGGDKAKITDNETVKNTQSESTIEHEEIHEPATAEPKVDLFSDDIPSVSINPLEPPIDAEKKAYTDLGTTATETGKTKTPTDTGGFQESKVSSEPVKPKRTPQEIKTQAEQTVLMWWKFYDKIHSILRWWGKVDEAQLITEHLKGEIDLDTILPFGKKPVKLREFISEVNNTIDEQIVVSPELKTALTPAIIRICIKREWLLSDETYVAWTLIEDISTKIGIMVGLKKSFDMIIDTNKETMRQNKEILKNQEKIMNNQEKIINNTPAANGAGSKQAETNADKWAEEVIKDKPVAETKEKAEVNAGGFAEAVVVNP